MIHERIAQDITKKLKGVDHLERKVFPLVATEGTSYPFAVYQRNACNSLHCKDGVYSFQVDFTVKVVTANYMSGLAIIDLIIPEILSLPEESQMYQHVTLNSSYEETTEYGYVQTLSFTFVTNLLSIE